MKRRLAIAFLIPFAVLAVRDAHDYTITLKEYACPLCGHVFQSVKQIAGQPDGVRLDYKPVGAIYAPFPIPRCRNAAMPSSNGAKRSTSPP